jgi:hypothetical protein
MVRQPSVQQQRRGTRRGRQGSVSRSNSGSSSHSMHRLVVTQQAHHAQISTSQDDANSPTTRASEAPSVGRPITPTLELPEVTFTADGNPTPSEPAMPQEVRRSIPRLRSENLRRGSISSLSSIGTEISLGLPPPPRYTRSPLSRQPNLQEINEEGRVAYRPPYVEESARPDTANIDPERDANRAPPLTWASLVVGAAIDGPKSPVPVIKDGPSRRANVTNSDVDAEGTPPPGYL